MNTGSFSGYYRPLSHNDIEAIHQATMRILEKTGFRIDNERALTLFQEKGAQVDFAKKLVKVRENWVMDLLKKAPARIILYGREDKHNLAVEPNHVFFGTGGTALNIYDRFSGDRRPTNIQDVADIARLTDALDNIDWYTLPVYPTELGKVEVDINRFYAGLKNTSKHIMGGIYGSHGGAREVIRLAQVIAGGAEELRKRPIISVICSTISPLTFEANYVDFYFDLVEAGVPIAPSCTPIAGATSPVTLAGTLVQINAEAICGVLMAQVIEEGAPVFYSTVPTTANMKTMDFLFGAVENGIMNAACAQLASYYNLPMYATGGVTESKVFDVQNGYEKCMNNLLPALGGAQLIHNAAGQMDSSMTVAYEQYVIDDDIIGMARRVLRGIKVDRETLAEEEIASAGPGGNFVGAVHTVEHFRQELFMPRAAVRSNFAAWERESCKNAVDLAREAVDKILEEHRPLPLPEGVEDEIKAIFPELHV